MSKGIHRSTPNSLSGRRMNNVAKEIPVKLTPEQFEWNVRVEQKKAAKKARRELQAQQR